MSLRGVHVFFIVTAMSLMAFLSYWSGQRLLQGQDGVNKVLLAASALGLLGGVPYLAWFLNKTRHL